LPAGLGREGAGVVEAVGPRARGVAPGDRVAYVSPQAGAYAQERLIAADRLVRIPDGVSDRLAAAAMLKGLTARYLLRRTYRVRKGDTVVVHAAAGGVGLILAQWARHLGARVIGVVGSGPRRRSRASTAATTHCCSVATISPRACAN
jgi:NADPH2:quinone reductase